MKVSGRTSSLLGTVFVHDAKNHKYWDTTHATETPQTPSFPPETFGFL